MRHKGILILFLFLCFFSKSPEAQALSDFYYLGMMRLFPSFVTAEINGHESTRASRIERFDEETKGREQLRSNQELKGTWCPFWVCEKVYKDTKSPFDFNVFCCSDNCIRHTHKSIFNLQLLKDQHEYVVEISGETQGRGPKGKILGVCTIIDNIHDAGIVIHDEINQKVCCGCHDSDRNSCIFSLCPKTAK